LYKLFLTLRYLRKRRIAYFAIAAVTLCVAMVLIVMSVMGGWLDMVKQRARGLLGDVIVDNGDPIGFPLYQQFIDEITEWPEVVKATPVIYTWGVLHFRQTAQTRGVRVLGIRLDEVYVVNAFKNSLFYEKFYPGTTHLGEQQQPLKGYDLEAEPIPLKAEDGTVVGYHPRPILPPAYQQALARSQAQGIVDTDSVETESDRILRDAGVPPIPGEYREVDDVGPPRVAGDPWPGLVVGRDVMFTRQSDAKYKRYWFYPRGCLVTVTVVPVSPEGTVDVPLKQAFRYADDSYTGIFEIDSQHVYCDFDRLQKLLEMDATPRADDSGIAPARCSQIQIKIAEQVDGQPVDPVALCRRLEERYQSYIGDERFDVDATDQKLLSRIKAMTWQESQMHIILPVEKEKILVTILFGIISLVAVALILCILYMIVLQKTRDIGVIKSIGGSSGGVAAIFVSYGAAVGIAGSIFGTILGSVVVHYINDIQDALTWFHPALRVWDPAVYSFDTIPSEVRTVDAICIVGVAILASTLGSLVAAWRAGTMQPVEALRYE
jgi:lipoprotein-releasing system permease protein